MAARGADLAAAHARLEAALADVEPPFALVDLDAFWANGADLLRRAGGKAVRVASKSLRCRSLMRAILDRPASELGLAAGAGFEGLMTFTLEETLWLYEQGFDDFLLAYPSAERRALARLGELDGERPPILMIDSTAHLDLIDAAAARRRRAIRVCLEFDTSLALAGGRVRIGPKRSPLRTPAQVAALARVVVARPGFELAAIMGYEGHVAGLGDRPSNPALGVAIRRMQRAARKRVAELRAAVVAAVREVAPVEIVNGGGTGSIETTAAEPVVTEVTAGSGFYAPTLFDRYTAFRPRPAAIFCLPVARKPSEGVATVLGGGYPASGPAGRDRLPEPYLPAGLRLIGVEGAGEVQTPLIGEPARRLQPGDHVYFRHAKAGELCERFATLHLVEGDRVVDEVPTYRGEGRTFV
jgi:D-serine deaminase-like pyridoxal phosphate-dependent protein